MSTVYAKFLNKCQGNCYHFHKSTNSQIYKPFHLIYFIQCVYTLFSFSYNIFVILSVYPFMPKVSAGVKVEIEVEAAAIKAITTPTPSPPISIKTFFSAFV